MQLHGGSFEASNPLACSLRLPDMQSGPARLIKGLRSRRLHSTLLMHMSGVLRTIDGSPDAEHHPFVCLLSVRVCL